MILNRFTAKTTSKSPALEEDGTLRSRVWSLEGTERTLVLDAHHEELEPK